MSKVTRCTGEKIESIGMTPIVCDRLFLSAEAYPRPRSTVTSTARRPLALMEAMCRSGFSTSTSEVSCRWAAVSSAGPRTSRRSVTCSSECTRTRRSLRLRMMSVTSSLTPGSVVNSCSASSKRNWVTAPPGMDESSVRRKELPSVVPKPGSSGPTAKRWRLFSSSSTTSTVGRWMISMAGTPVGPWGRGRGLLRVELDDELLLDGLVDVLTQRGVEDGHREACVGRLEPGRRRALEGVHVAADHEVGAGGLAQRHDVALADAVTRDGDPLVVHVHVPVPHELAGLAPAGSPARPEDHVVEPQLEFAQQVLTGDAALAGGLLVHVAELLLQNPVNPARLL